MYELKRLHEGSLDAAIARAEHYRLLNEPAQAESICLDSRFSPCTSARWYC